MPSDAEDASSASQSDEDREEDMEVDKSTGSASKGSSNGRKNSSSAKDPSRPRRKKARRACMACQRAHLTCGDERPCGRCIKRGLADSCQDGFRKKAKYLHDAPPEALMPGVIGDYSPLKESKSTDSVPIDMSDANSAFAPNSFLPPGSTANYQQYPQHAGQLQMAPPSMQDASMIYGNQRSPVSHRPSLLHSMGNVLPPHTPQQLYGGGLLDPSDPSFFNIDISNMNFGNRYGALELGMLNHMSSGAENLMQPGRTHSTSSIYEASPSSGYAEPTSDQAALTFSPTDGSMDWTGGQTISSATTGTNAFSNYGNVKRGSRTIGPYAYSIEAGPHYHGSPGSIGADLMPQYDSTGLDSTMYGDPQASLYNGSQYSKRQSSPEPEIVSQSNTGPVASISSRLGSESIPSIKKRRRDPSSIYESVKQPYPYTEGFHIFVAFIRRRFSSQKRLRIAQALSRVRPSFIACTRGLEAIDLLMMEKVFQRSRLQFEEHIASVGIPTIVCRRTGEVACVGKEFTLLTGWRRDVLLGREPNLNTNIGSGGASGAQTGNSTRGWNTPRLTSELSAQDGGKAAADPLRPQPVFLAELLDDDSVIEFYEEFANVAFADSRESVKQRCNVLKYKTKDDPGFGSAVPDDSNKDSSSPEQTRAADPAAGSTVQPMSSSSPVQLSKPRKRNYSGLLLNQHHKGEPIIRAEAGMQKLGDKEGKVDCMCTWTVKRDMFDMPMMIVLNFLPVLETRD